MLETETVLDRRRMRRSLTLWRAAGIAGVALAFGALLFGNDTLSTLSGEKQIARVAIEGTITEDREQLKMLQKIAASDHVAGVLLYVNSPGGTTTGGEALYEGLREIAKTKPVVAQFGTVAASAGYIVGLASDHIVARGNTITGSVGVLIQWPEFAELMNKVGVKVNEVKSGPLKAAPSPFEPMKDDARKVVEAMIGDGFKWFVGLVEERRGIKANEVAGLMEGRIFSGREALTVRLIDQIGGEDQAVAWLKDVKNVAKDAKLVDWKPEQPGGFKLGLFGAKLASSLFGSAGEQMAGWLMRDPTISSLGLDGLVSVWHPSEK
ncbi:MAG: signal peptide peptidase SppA [Hyphomicrobium sp.]